jgi:hypothetical protein
MHRTLFVSLPLCFGLISCSSQVPTSTGAEHEAAMVQRESGDASVEADETTDAAEEDVAGAPVQTTVSPAFHAEAVSASSALNDLARATESEAVFDAALVAARAQVMAARAAVKTHHDRNAAIVLTALLAKQKELTFLNLLIRRNSTIQPDPQLESEVQACSNELRAWLEGSDVDAEELQRRECLTAARAARSSLPQ